MSEHHDDFAFEPIPGLPELPPEDEKILWQGNPSRSSMAVHVFHVRKIVIYFGLLMAFQLASGLYEGATAAVIAGDLAVLVAGSALCLALLAGLAWGYSRSTIYTITSKRLVMRHGIALPMSINIPFSKIDAAQMVEHANGTGTITLRINEENRLAWLALWPSVRPWSFKSPEPALRCIDRPRSVSSLIATTMAAAEGDCIEIAPVAVSTLPAGGNQKKQDDPGLHGAATA
ncbi:MAG: photosynthetic complex putative assembly protein PuhB [Pseudomonadota bacterium]